RHVAQSERPPDEDPPLRLPEPLRPLLPPPPRPPSLSSPPSESLGVVGASVPLPPVVPRSSPSESGALGVPLLLLRLSCCWRLLLQSSVVQSADGGGGALLVGGASLSCAIAKPGAHARPKASAMMMRFMNRSCCG